MGWWQGLNGVNVIGDGPADRLGLALDSIVAAGTDAARFEDLVAGFGQALNRNPSAYVSDPDVGLESILATFESHTVVRCGIERTGIPRDWVDLFQSGIEEATVDYLDSPRTRKPTVDELMETFAFVLRPLGKAIRWPDASPLQTLSAVTNETAPQPADLSGQIVTLLKQSNLRLVDDVLSSMRWLRDPDRSDARTSVPDELSLASWSRSEGDDGEVDYHFDERSGARWLEVRGENAKERALDIANMLGGKHEGTAADALAKALTPPRSGPAARPTASGTLRWRTLREVIAKANPVNMGIIVALIRAGLRDPDWRVRMTAMLGVGKLRLAALAEEAMAAKVPATGTSALGGEDRRVLLALRQAAHDRALGLSPSVGPGHGHSPDIADKRRAYQQRLHQLLAGEHPSDASDAAAMVAALLSPEKSAPPLPPRWRSWIDRDDNPK